MNGNKKYDDYVSSTWFWYHSNRYVHEVDVIIVLMISIDHIMKTRYDNK